jgi:hypothetical protein
MRRDDAAMKRLWGDETGLIASYLLKMLIGFALTAVVLFDAGSIGVNFFTLDSTADDIAVKLSTGLTPSQVPRQVDLEAEAGALATEAGAKLISVELTQEGNIVVKIRRRADTLVVKHIGAIKDWARSTAEGRAGTT